MTRVRPVYRSRDDCATGLTWLARYIVAEPRDAAFALPRRTACRMFGRHNITCRGRRDHPRTSS